MLRSELSAIDPMLRGHVEAEVQAGERVIWAQQPVPRFFSGRSLGPVIFGIPWTAFALFWTFTSFTMTGHITPASGPIPKGFHYFFPLFGVPFMLVGFG